MYGELEKLTGRLLAKLHPSNLVSTIFYLVFEHFDSQIVKNSILEASQLLSNSHTNTVISGVENRDKAYTI